MSKEISLEITNNCPNRCIHCSSMSSPQCDIFMDKTAIFRAIDCCKLLKFDTICLSGGEPFCHPDIASIIRKIHDQGIICKVYSSGIILDGQLKKSIPSDVIVDLKDCINSIIFNLQSPQEEIYNKIMGTKGCFPILCDSIKKCTDAGITVEAHFVPMPINSHLIRETVDFCVEHRISRISFLNLVLHGRALQNIDDVKLPEDEKEKVMAELRGLKSADIDIRIGVSMIGPHEGYKCEAAENKLNIRYDGVVFPCEIFKNTTPLDFDCSRYDNINNNDLSQIYYESELLVSVRKRIKSGMKEPCVGISMINFLGSE